MASPAPRCPPDLVPLLGRWYSEGTPWDLVVRQGALEARSPGWPASRAVVDLRAGRRRHAAHDPPVASGASCCGSCATRTGPSTPCGGRPTGCRGSRSASASEARQAPPASSASRSRSAYRRCHHSSLSTVSRASRTGNVIPAVGQPGPSTTTTSRSSPSSVRSVRSRRTRPARSARSAQDGVEVRTGRPVPWHARGVRHPVPGQGQRVPRRRVGEDAAPHPRLGREDEVAQGLDEGPLAADRLVEQGRLEPPGPLDRPGPQVLEDVPRPPEARGVGRLHQAVLGVTPGELGLDEGGDVDAVDGDVDELTADLDPLQLHAAQPDVAEQRVLDLGPLDEDVLDGVVLDEDVAHPSAVQPVPPRAGRRRGGSSRRRGRSRRSWAAE